MPRLVDLTGSRFGKLTVLKRYVVPQHLKGTVGFSNNNARWECECDCGNTRIVEGPVLRMRTVTSCGCAPEMKALMAKDSAAIGFRKTMREKKLHAQEVEAELTKSLAEQASQAECASPKKHNNWFGQTLSAM